MAAYKEFEELTKGLGIDCDCPVCGYSWPGCQGACVSHTARNGKPGPYHTDYNDDCLFCIEEAMLDEGGTSDVQG